MSEPEPRKPADEASLGRSPCDRIAWIEVISEEEADGQLAELYERERLPQTNAVDNILKVHSLRPETLHDHAGLFRTLMLTPGGLKPAEREMIGVVVSEINECFY